MVDDFHVRGFVYNGTSEDRERGYQKIADICELKYNIRCGNRKEISKNEEIWSPTALLTRRNWIVSRFKAGQIEEALGLCEEDVLTFRKVADKSPAYWSSTCILCSLLFLSGNEARGEEYLREIEESPAYRQHSPVREEYVICGRVKGSGLDGLVLLHPEYDGLKGLVVEVAGFAQAANDDPPSSQNVRHQTTQHSATTSPTTKIHPARPAEPARGWKWRRRS